MRWSNLTTVCCAAAGLALAPLPVAAVVPPDLVVSVGSQIAGFFSFFVVLIGSVIASLGIVYARWYPYFRRYAAYVAFGLLAVLLLGSNYVLWSEITALRAQPPTVVAPPDFTREEGEEDCDVCEFQSDGLILFSPDENDPFVLDLSLNRIQEPSGAFTHYYFLDGFMAGESVSDYTQFLASETTPEAYGFLGEFARIPPADKSVRDRYAGEVTMNGQSVSFSVPPVNGDFITRNRPTQTQYQSAVRGEVRIGDESRPVYVLAEALHANDFRPDVFFPGYEDMRSLTYQFILWDEEGSFYLIDRSDTLSDTPAYPSHSWLLYKEAGTGFTKKGFETTVTELGSEEWVVTAPAFRNARITVSATATFHPADGEREKWIVRGVILDERGERGISGILLRLK